MSIGERWVLLMVLGMATLDCTRARTEIVVRVESEYAWGPSSELQSVVLEVRRSGATGPQRSYRSHPLGTDKGRWSLPLRVGLYPRPEDDDTATPLWVEALGCATPNGCTRDDAVVAQRAIVSFAPQQTLDLRMVLAFSCRGVRCEVDRRCDPSISGCVSARVQPPVLGAIDNDSGVATADSGIDAAEVGDVSDSGVNVADVFDSPGDLPVIDVIVDSDARIDASDAADVRDSRDVIRDATSPVDLGSLSCVGDTDGDGLTDMVEGAPSTDTDGDGTPDFRDSDSDGDGIADSVEARRGYPGFESRSRELVCGATGDNCDDPADALPNWRDRDSDNDGLSDRDEVALRTNPCAVDTDGDSESDLMEVAAMSNPVDASSVPPAGLLRATLPYQAPPVTTPRETRDFEFTTRIRQADVFFLIDNSQSMLPVIDNLRTNFRGTIVPGVTRVIPDVRFGVGSFDSMPERAEGVPPTMTFRGDGEAGRPGDYTLWIRQGMSTDSSAAQRAFDNMRTIDDDTSNRYFGGDGPENATEAAYEAIVGEGSRGMENDAAALRSVRNALDPMGNGWVPRHDPRRDCPANAAAPPYGWACFGEGRVPILVLASDAGWYDGCASGSPTSVRGHNCDQLISGINLRGGFFLGIDVGTGLGGATYQNAEIIAMRTRSVNAVGRPIVLGPGRGGVSGVAQAVVDTITTFESQSRQDITSRTVSDATATGLPAGQATANFVRSVVPLSGVPESPVGYERRDTTHFYNVAPNTRVTFRVNLVNDFVVPSASARFFRATINVIARGGTVVDVRTVLIAVPSQS